MKRKIPIVELSVLLGLVFLVIGALMRGHAGVVLVVVGVSCASVAGFAHALEEHLNATKSHATVLAGLPTVIALGVTHHFGLHRTPMLLIAGVTFVVAWRACNRFYGFANPRY